MTMYALQLDVLPEGREVPRLSEFTVQDLLVDHFYAVSPAAASCRTGMHLAQRHLAFRSDAQTVCPIPAFSQPFANRCYWRGVTGIGG